MDYEFKDVESLIRNAFDSANKSNSEFEARLAEIRSALSEQSIRARRKFTLKVASCDRHEIAKTLVHFHQQALINLSDELSAGPMLENKSDLKDKLRFLIEQVEDLIYFLESQFGDLFNFESRPSEFFSKNSAQNLRIIGDQIVAKFPPPEDGRQELLEIALASIEQLIFSSGDHLSYKVFDYSTAFLNRLHEIIKANQCDNDRLKRFLIEMNHTSAPFVENYIHQIQSQLDGLHSTTDQIEFLAKCLKEVNQIQTVHNLRYDLNAGNVRDWLAGWLLEEIQYLETKRSLTPNGSITEDTATKKEFKMEFDMSVAQFACFVKSFVETGVIQNKNISELIRFLAKFVKTKRSENISYESFRMKYYNVETNTKDAVRNLFHTAIGRINST